MTIPNHLLREDDEDVEFHGWLIRKHRNHYDVRDPKTEHWTEDLKTFESARLFIEWRTGIISWGEYLRKDFWPIIQQKGEAQAAIAIAEAARRPFSRLS